MIILLIIFAFGAFSILALLLAGGVVLSQSGAKKQAKQMLEAGVPGKDVDRVLNILSHVENDLEASDLWKRLKNLKEGKVLQGKVSQCAKCGAALLPNSSFCQSCGTPVR
jgi:uncharacterized paraquat-inducible protein A